MVKPTVGFRDILKLLGSERLRFGTALVALVMAACVLYLVPLIPQAVIDGVLGEPSAITSKTTIAVVEILGGRDFLVTHLWVPLLAIAGIAIIAGACIYLRQRLCAN